MPQGSTDNPSAFKHAYRPERVAEMATILQRIPEFDRERFDAAVLPTLEDLEMKARVDLLVDGLAAALPLPFPAAAGALVSVLGPPGAPAGKDSWGPDDPSGDGLSGFGVWPLTRFVARFGLDHHDAAMAALEQMTRRWTAEFALRPFLVREPDRTLAVLLDWTSSDDQHLRRAASEATRPRLPWGQRLRAFVADPSPTLPILEALRCDPEEYVRRSVANHLNDIGKDHPERLVAIARRWWAEGDANTRRIVRHGLRSLVKEGHPGALRILGFTVPARVAVEGPRLSHEALVLGQTLQIEATLRSLADQEQRLVVDWVLHLQGAGGRPRRKVFKGTTLTLPPRATDKVRHRLPLRPVTTRRYYPGTHRVEVLVCGEGLGQAEFMLVLPD